MEKALREKGQGKLTGWLAGGIAGGVAFIVATVLFVVYLNQAAAGVYDTAAITISSIGSVEDTYGAVVILTLIFFIGLLVKKGEMRFFVKFFCWAILAASLYYIMPRFADFYNIVEYNSTITTLQTLHILTLMIPQMLFTAAILSYVIQLDSDNKKVTYTLSWFAFLAAIVMFVVEVIYISNQIGAADRTLNILYYSMDAFATLTLAFLAAVIHRASQKSKGEFFGI